MKHPKPISDKILRAMLASPGPIDVTLIGKPVSVNELYRGRRFLTAIGKKAKEDYFYQAKKQYRGPLLEGDLIVELKVYFTSKNASDIDNVCKATLDSLTGVIWKDDRQIVELHVYKRQDKTNPRIEVIVQSILEMRIKDSPEIVTVPIIDSDDIERILAR